MVKALNHLLDTLIASMYHVPNICTSYSGVIVSYVLFRMLLGIPNMSKPLLLTSVKYDYWQIIVYTLDKPSVKTTITRMVLKEG